ncbi:MAG: hypothetical protein EBQ87_11055, partial [Planctomycetes bacterium]|nr:hypothetical protein [Planctomycetota bacterium]
DQVPSLLLPSHQNLIPGGILPIQQMVRSRIDRGPSRFDGMKICQNDVYQFVCDPHSGSLIKVTLGQKAILNITFSIVETMKNFMQKAIIRIIFLML